MDLRLTSRNAILLVLLASSFVFLTWKVKKLESAAMGGSNISALQDQPAPDFTLKTLSGETVSLKDYRGKKVVISFWASWCGPCRRELPELKRFYELYHKQNPSFEILAISTDDNKDDPLSFYNEQKLPFVMPWDEHNTTGNAYGVSSIPALFVVDENGKVIYTQEGYFPGLAFILQQKLGLKQIPPGKQDQANDTSD